MKLWGRMPVACLALAWGANCAIAQEDRGFESNRLRNGRFIPADAAPGTFPNWVQEPAGWERKEIPTFKGWPWTLHCLERTITKTDYYTLYQDDLAVEPNTWYVLSAWYKADLVRKSSYGVFTLSAQAEVDGKMRWISETLCGASENWVLVKCYLLTGERRTIRFQARFSGRGTCAIGNPNLHKLTDTDVTTPTLADGNFEKGIVGAQATDLPDAYVVTGAGFPGSAKSARLVIPANTIKWHTFSNPGLAKVGARVRTFVWAKTDQAGTVLQCGTQRTPLTTQWQHYEFEEIVSDSPADSQGRKLKPVNVFLRIWGDAGSAVWFDDVQITVESPDEASAAEAPRGKNLVALNSSFEVGLTGWDYSIGRNCMNSGPAQPDTPVGSVTNDTSTAAEGSSSLRAHLPENSWQFKDSLFYIGCTYFPIKLHKPYTVSFWAKTDNPSELDVRMEKSSDTVKFNLTKEWKRYHFQYTPRSSNTGKTSLNIIWSNTTGNLWLDAVQVEEGELSDYEPAGKLEVGGGHQRLYAFYKKDESVEGLVFLCSRLQRDAEVELSRRVVDWRENVVDSTVETVRVPPGETIIRKVPLFTKRTGAFIVEYELKDPQSGEIASNAFVYGVFPEPRKLANPEESWFGLQTCLILRKTLVLKGGNLDDFYKQAFAFTGAHWTFNMVGVGTWRINEPESGKYYWNDTYFDVATRNRLRVFLNFGAEIRDIPQWAYSKRHAYDKFKHNRNLYYPKMEYWDRYVRTYIEHYGERLAAIEPFSETGYLSPEECVKMYEVVYRAAQELNPKLLIVGVGYPNRTYGLQPWDTNSWLIQALKLGLYDNIDVYSAHFYGAGRVKRLFEFEDLIGPHGSIVGLLHAGMSHLRKTYSYKPVWDTECGNTGAPQLRWMDAPDVYEANQKWTTPAQQANRFARWTVYKKASGVNRIFPQTFNGYNLPPFRCGHPLTDVGVRPKPVTVAYAQLARRLDMSTFKDVVKREDSTVAHLFDVGGQPVVTYWNHRMSKPGKMKLALTADIAVEDEMGNEIVPERTNAGIVLPLDKSVVYVSSAKIDGPALLKKFADAIVLRQCRLAVGLGSKDRKPSVVLNLFNRTGAPAGGTVEITKIAADLKTTSRKVTFADVPHDTEAKEYIPFDGHRTQVEGALLKATGKVGQRVVQAERTIWLAHAPRRKSEINIDGRITEQEYGAARSVVLDRREQLSTSGKIWKGPESCSAKMRLVWDAQALYAGIEVADDKVINQSSDKTLWEGDSIELYLDTEPDEDMFESIYHPHQGRVNCAPPSEPGGSARWAFKTADYAGVLKHVDLERVRAASQRTDAGYTLELMIPVKDITLSAGMVWGMNFVTMDYDTQDPRDLEALCWAGKNSWQNPLEFGAVALVP